VGAILIAAVAFGIWSLWPGRVLGLGPAEITILAVIAMLLFVRRPSVELAKWFGRKSVGG
jgi:hypothetical protein